MQNNSISTTLKMVADLNRCFGNLPWHEIQADKPTLHAYLCGQVSLIEEEMYQELKGAENEGDVPAMLDAIGDSITVIDGLAHKCGLDDYSSHCDVLSLMAPPQPCAQQVITLEEFYEIPRYVSENEVGLLTFELWRWHRSFIEAYSIRKGFDPLKVYEEVHSSNMSKFCDTPEEAVKSLEKYLHDYGLTSITQTLAYKDGSVNILDVNPLVDLKVELVNGKYVIKTNREVYMGDKRVAPGKFLKGINFKEPDFSDLERFYLPLMTAPSL